MIKIAIIQFPGINTEYETRREIKIAGMKGEFFRWNDDYNKLRKYDGYVIGGGFAYEDRGRAGIIAALDPLIEILREETATKRKKPLVGICNGCQILVESGLAPGAQNQKLCFGMARNKRMQDGEILGTGYYNDWVYVKNTVPKGRTAFTQFIDENEVFAIPVAHGEGRFTTTIPGILDRLIKNKQIVFRYCDKNGIALPEFPVNPNGSLWNIAAICNPEGNIMAIMPHFERCEESQTFFVSMKAYIENGMKIYEKAKKLIVQHKELLAQTKYNPCENSIQFFVDLIITDNEAETFENTIKRLGLNNVSLKRKTYYEIALNKGVDLQKTAKKIIQSGIILNTNKEIANVKIKNEKLRYSKEKMDFVAGPAATSATEALAENATFNLLVCDKQDFVGLQKRDSLRRRLSMPEISEVKKATLWHLYVNTKSEKGKEQTFRKLMKMHLFQNPHSQNIYLWNI